MRLIFVAVIRFSDCKYGLRAVPPRGVARLPGFLISSYISVGKYHDHLVRFILDFCRSRTFAHAHFLIRQYLPQPDDTHPNEFTAPESIEHTKEPAYR